MALIEIAAWRLDVDPGSTRAAYQRVERGYPEICGCRECRNYMAAREYAYPPEALHILNQLGIDPTKEAEAYGGYKQSSGNFLYFGWFHFVGQILEGDDSSSKISESAYRINFEEISANFEIGLTLHAALVPEAFRGKQVVQLEFKTEVPWLLAEKPTYGD